MWSRTLCFFARSYLALLIFLWVGMKFRCASRCDAPFRALRPFVFLPPPMRPRDFFAFEDPRPPHCFAVIFYEVQLYAHEMISKFFTLRKETSLPKMSSYHIHVWCNLLNCPHTPRRIFSMAITNSCVAGREMSRTSKQPMLYTW